jgi:hypothetical protein
VSIVKPKEQVFNGTSMETIDHQALDCSGRSWDANQPVVDACVVKRHQEENDEKLTPS